MQMSNTGSAIAITEPEAYDKVLDNEALRHFCILGNVSGIQCSGCHDTLESLRPNPKSRSLKNDENDHRKRTFCRLSILPYGIVIAELALLFYQCRLSIFFKTYIGSSKTR